MASREPYHGITEPLSTKGADPAILLAALYNNANSGGMGLLQYRAQDMSVADARAILQELQRRQLRLYFGYINGRALKLVFDPAKEQITQSKYGSYNGFDTADVVALARAGISGRVREPFDAAGSLDAFLSTTGSTVQRGPVTTLGITQELSDALEEVVARNRQAAPEMRPSYHIDLPAGFWEKGKQVFTLTLTPAPAPRTPLGRLWRRLRGRNPG